MRGLDHACGLITDRSATICSNTAGCGQIPLAALYSAMAARNVWRLLRSHDSGFARKIFRTPWSLNRQHHMVKHSAGPS